MAVRPGRKPGLWLVEFEQGGARIHKRLPPGTSKAQAEAWERQRRRELFDREELGKFPQITLDEAIKVWLRENRRKNQKQAVSEAKQWEPFVGGRLLRDAPAVAQTAMHNWRTPVIPVHTPNLRPRPLPSTLNRRLALLKAVCKHAYKRGLIQENLSGRITLLKENNQKDIFLTKAQVKRLVSKARSQEVKASIIIAAYSGLRAAEIISLPQTPTGAATLTVLGKGDKTRSVPVAAAIRPYLSALPLELSYWQLRKEFMAARKKAGLPPTVTLHTLRHTCASWLIQAGVDLYTVGRILGHSSTQTTARYAHLSDASLKAAMGKLK